MFNALKYIKNLEGVGFPREQAEAQVQLVIDSFEDNIATKSDIADLRTEMAQIRGELRAEMAELKAGLTTTIVGSIVASTTVMTGLLGALGFFIKS